MIDHVDGGRDHRQGGPQHLSETSSSEQDGSQTAGLGSGRWSTEVPPRHLSAVAVGRFGVLWASAFPEPFRAGLPLRLDHQSGI